MGLKSWEKRLRLESGTRTGTETGLKEVKDGRDKE